MINLIITIAIINNNHIAADIICFDVDFSYLCDLITANVDVLEAATNEEWTLFAPPNSAFDAISGPLATLSGNDLVRVILFHGVVEADDLECGELVGMLDAGSIRTSCHKNSDGDDIIVQKGGGNRKNDILPEIVQTNIAACNGNFIDEFD